MNNRLYERALVLAPHTDDGELGAGGTIARLIHEGTEVRYVAFCNAAASLPEGYPPDTLTKEVVAATAELGIPAAKVSVLDYPVRRFGEHRQEILEDMIRLRSDFDPDLVLLPSAHDIHQDHQVISQEGTRAFKNRDVLGYELVWNTLSSEHSLHVRLVERQIAAKVRSLAAYRSQSGKQYMSEDFVRSLAQVRGINVGSQFAEAFEVIRIAL